MEAESERIPSTSSRGASRGNGDHSAVDIGWSRQQPPSRKERPYHDGYRFSILCASFASLIYPQWLSRLCRAPPKEQHHPQVSAAPLPRPSGPLGRSPLSQRRLTLAPKTCTPTALVRSYHSAIRVVWSEDIQA